MYVYKEKHRNFLFGAVEKRLRSSLQSSATKKILKSSKASLKTLVHSIKPSSPLCSSLPPILSDSISASLQSFLNLLEPDSAANLGSPPSKRPRRSSLCSEP
ncbi:hypothetical protein JHK85_030719 [Glycine max]|nr:hypothetical protein JHK85_030719 [Glycine max]